MWEGGRGKHQGGLPGGESIQDLEEHFSSQGYTPEFLIGTNCHMLYHSPLVLTSGAGVILTSHSAPQEWVQGGGVTFPRSHNWGLSSNILPSSPQLPLLPGRLAPAVSCSEVNGYFYSGLRGSRAAEPCRLEGSRTTGFSRQREVYCRDRSLPGGSPFLHADLPLVPRSPETSILELRTEHRARLNPSPESRSSLSPNLCVN